MVDTWVTLSVSDALVSFEFGTLLYTLGVKVTFGPNVGNVMDWSLGTLWSILNMSDILVPFGHFWKFWSFLDIWSPGHDGYIICWSVWTLFGYLGNLR